MIIFLFLIKNKIIGNSTKSCRISPRHLSFNILVTNKPSEQATFQANCFRDLNQMNSLNTIKSELNKVTNNPRVVKSL